MKVKLVGLQPLDFESKNGGNVKGINLHCVFIDENVYGSKADTKFMSDIILKNLGLTLDDLLPFINSDVDLDLNFNGKVNRITPITES